MQFGVNLLIWTANFTEPHFPLLPGIKEQGFDGVELPLFNPDGYPAGAVRKELEANGLKCTTCCIIPSGSLFDADNTNRKKAMDQARPDLDV